MGNNSYEGQGGSAESRTQSRGQFSVTRIEHPRRSSFLAAAWKSQASDATASPNA